MKSKGGALNPSSSKGSLGVLIDGRKIRDGGIGVYTQNIIAGLIATQEETGVRVGVLGDSDLLASFDWSDRVSPIHETADTYSMDELFGITRRIRPVIEREDYNVFHSPHYTLPFRLPIPSIVSIHDLIHVHHPEKVYYPPIASFLIRSSVNRSGRIATVSDATRNDLLEFLDGGSTIADKVVVIPNALNANLSTGEADPDYLRRELGVEGAYLLCVVSMLKPHKGVGDLLEAFKELSMAAAGAAPGGVKLVLAGKGAEKQSELRKIVRSVGAENVPLQVVGEVSDQDLYHLYAGALALIVPSKAEGFCLPVIEAQSLGVPVLARPVPAIKEIVTRQDRVCEDFSVESLRNMILGFFQAIVSGKVSMSERHVDKSHLRRFDHVELGRAWYHLYCETAGIPVSGVFDESVSAHSDALEDKRQAAL